MMTDDDDKTEPRRRAALSSAAVVNLLSGLGRPAHVHELAARLGGADLGRLRRLLQQLADDGVVASQSGQRYRLKAAPTAAAEELLEGTIMLHPRGFGFVGSPANGAHDVFVEAEAMGGAMHGDVVQVRIVSRGSRGLAGEVVQVLRRGRSRVAGLLQGRGASRWLEPDDSRIRGPIVIREVAGDAEAHRRDVARPERAGQRSRRTRRTSGPGPLAAVVELTRYPELCGENPEGKLIAVLGEPGHPDVEVAKILLEHSISEQHSAAATAEAEAATWPPAEELAARADLTGVPLLTIDPQDARDFDDAVHVERTGDGGFRATIAVADVSHYVPPGSALDAEALERSCSVYLPDRAVPMLPAALSSDLCSLLPGQERLCFAVIVEVDATGATVGATTIAEGRMRSRAKLTFAGVARALGLTSEPARCPQAEAHRDELQAMWELALLLRGRRLRRGALAFDLPEAQVLLDEESRAVVGVVQRTHDPGVRQAYHLVEELMLLANEAVAGYVSEHGLPAIFRVHAAPDPEKLDRFCTLASELGLSFELDDAADPRRLSSWLRGLEPSPRAEVLHMLLLRAMQQAVYDTVNIGHFGLACPAYLHFTSPIRRYPDLLVHRLLRQHLRGELPGRRGDPAADPTSARLAALTATERERNTMVAERKIADLYRALLMQSRIDEVFTATVSAITSGGVFCRIDEPFVDVLVSLADLGRDGHYEPDPTGLRAVGLTSGDRVQLGDTIEVQIIDCSVVRRTVYGRRLVQSRPPTTKAERRQLRREAAQSARDRRGARPRGARLVKRRGRR